MYNSCIASEGLKASWYSIESLKEEGTWKTSKGVMANGKLFKDGDYTCATRLYPLGAILRVFNLNNGKYIEVLVTDRIGKRFAKTRCDLSKGAFNQIANLKQGIVPIKIERIK
jgi:rare lipoprotein A (peptidoglycan hydrolase)